MTTATRSRPRATEEPPYRRLNTDGRINPGSYEVSGVIDVINLAHRLYLDAGDGQPQEPPQLPELRSLGRYLLAAADAIQRRATDTVDRQAASHNRALRCLRTALNAHPVPWGADTPDREAWWETVVDRASSIYTLALELVDEP
jgi:hypothetical protein